MSGTQLSRPAGVLFGALSLLLLTACGFFASPSAQRTQPPDAAATQAAHIVETEFARPTRTPTPAATQTSLPPSQTPVPEAELTSQAVPSPTAVIQVTPLPGLEFFTHSESPGYVFQVDPARWNWDSQEGTSLNHKTIPGCQIYPEPGHGLAAPVRYFWQDLGRFRWEVMEYGAYAFAFPIAGAGVSELGGSFLHLQGYNLAACRADQEAVLKNVMMREEAAGKVPYSLYASPTPRPALQGFDCPNTPPSRLRIGDVVSVITNGLWLRSEPRADKSTELRQFLRYPPVMIRITGGPVCEKYVYWQVDISTFGEGGQTTRGWLAEGDAQEYYLAPVK